MTDLSGKTVVITGGSGVLGTAMCHALAAAGANIIILARTPEKTIALAEELHTRHGVAAIGIAADVLEVDALRAAAEQVRERFGQVDILINGAGGNYPEAITTPQRSFFDIPKEALQGIFDLNLIGAILPSQIFGKMMAEAGQGVILNVSSMASVRPLTRVVAYSAAKNAINNFTQWLAVHMAQEYSPDIRVNAIAPGFLVADQNRALLLNPDGSLTERGQAIIAHTPMGRFGEPEDLIGTLLWLVSDASRFVTGIVVPVDGGFSAFGGV
jgi:NAD(P)-dependent dehydrogenase (short-subunit alcohol dehydrogenase family)